MNPNDTQIAKIIKYCTYQERCHSEVRTKLLKMEIYGDKLEEIMSFLITEKFLNEERYAKAVARGKHRNNKWGRHKIIRLLKSKYVSEYCIQESLKEIEEDEYFEMLKQILSKQKESYLRKTFNDFQLRHKLSNYAAQKGYEYELINAALGEIWEQ